MGALSLTASSIVLFFFISCSSFTPTEAFDRFDPNGNISIKWDVLNWTPDGYVAVVTIYNFQRYRRIQAPGWKLGWTWAREEIIWSLVGGKAMEQGDCSRFLGNIPRCCKTTPTIVDLKPGVPFQQQIANCCKGGLLSSWFRDRSHSVSAFQITVGQTGTSQQTVKLPKSFTFKAPGDGYTCGPAKIVRPTRLITPDKRRTMQALMTWNVTCMYSGSRNPHTKLASLDDGSY